MESKSGNITIEEPIDKFKKVNMGLIMNKEIDCLTLGVYVKILTFGKTWNLNIKGLSTVLNLSDSKIRKSISLLEKEGYISRHAVKDEDGKFVGWDYKFYSEPIEKECRTQAGKRTYQKTDTPQNGQLGFWTTPKSDNTENGVEDIYRLKTTIDCKKEEEQIDNWRTSFDDYLALVNKAKEELLDDDEFYEKMNVYYPNADYDKTIDKMVSMFWGTELGWQNKKSKRSKKINMLSTLKTNYAKNIVYKERGQVGRVRLNPISDVLLQDGAINARGEVWSEQLKRWLK